MEVEFTARQVKISKALRTHAEEGMERLGRILGKSACASITFSAQRHVQIVELTVQGRAQKIAATGRADHTRCRTQGSHGTRGKSGAPLPRPPHGQQAPSQGRKSNDSASSSPSQSARNPTACRRIRTRNPAAAKARASIAVHSFPARATVVEPHILKNGEAIAIKPLTIEEAVKEAEFRDRDLLIFRTSSRRHVRSPSPPRRSDGVGGDSLEVCFTRSAVVRFLGQRTSRNFRAQHEIGLSAKSALILDRMQHDFSHVFQQCQQVFDSCAMQS